jgi:putative transposase
MRIRKLNHSVYQIQYHVVWGTKYRRKVLKYYVRDELIQSFYRVQRKYPDWYFHQINTGDDHVHLLIEIPPKYSISEVVQKLKCIASVDLRNKFKFIKEIYLEKTGMWSDGYFVSTVGLNEEQIKKYIQNQNKYDISQDVSKEFS